jgi:ABC-type nitrate/sulfonate/bicarbonate transport system substrate-binding protein
VAGDILTSPVTKEQLKAKIQGQSVTVGYAGTQVPKLTVLNKLIEEMKQDFGVTVTYRVMDASPLNAALISGQVNVGMVSLAGVATAADAGADLVVFAGDAQKNEYRVVAKAPVTDLAAVKGKSFAISQTITSIVGQTGEMCLKKAGMDINKDVKLLKLGNISQITQGLLSGSISAGLASVTSQQQLDSKAPGQFTILCKGWEVNPQLSAVFAVQRGWLEKNQALALAFTIAEIEASRWGASDETGWVDLAMKTNQGLSEDGAKWLYNQYFTVLDNWPVNGSLDKSQCQSTLDVSKEFGVTKKQYACSDLVTFAYQDAAVTFLGSR